MIDDPLKGTSELSKFEGNPYNRTISGKKRAFPKPRKYSNDLETSNGFGKTDVNQVTSTCKPITSAASTPTNSITDRSCTSSSCSSVDSDEDVPPPPLPQLFTKQKKITDDPPPPPPPPPPPELINNFSSRSNDKPPLPPTSPPPPPPPPESLRKRHLLSTETKPAKKQKTGTNEFKCKLCPKPQTFKLESALYEHMLNIHSLVSPQSLTSNSLFFNQSFFSSNNSSTPNFLIANPVQTVIPQQQPVSFTCQFCQQYFLSKELFETHMLMKHSTFCEYCNNPVIENDVCTCSNTSSNKDHFEDHHLLDNDINEDVNGIKIPISPLKYEEDTENFAFSENMNSPNYSNSHELNIDVSSEYYHRSNFSPPPPPLKILEMQKESSISPIDVRSTLSSRNHVSNVDDEDDDFRDVIEARLKKGNAESSESWRKPRNVYSILDKFSHSMSIEQSLRNRSSVFFTAFASLPNGSRHVLDKEQLRNSLQRHKDSRFSQNLSCI